MAAPSSIHTAGADINPVYSTHSSVCVRTVYSWSLSPSDAARPAAWRTVRLETGINNDDLYLICIFAIARLQLTVLDTGENGNAISDRQSTPSAPNCAYCARLGVSTFHWFLSARNLSLNFFGTDCAQVFNFLSCPNVRNTHGSVGNM